MDLENKPELLAKRPGLQSCKAGNGINKPVEAGDLQVSSHAFCSIQLRA